MKIDFQSNKKIGIALGGGGLLGAFFIKIPTIVTTIAKTPAIKKYIHLFSPAVSPAEPIVKNDTPGNININV